jgi:hypothetical protein
MCCRWKSYSDRDYLLSEGHLGWLALVCYDDNDEKWTEQTEVGPPRHSLQLKAWSNYKGLHLDAKEQLKDIWKDDLDVSNSSIQS